MNDDKDKLAAEARDKMRQYFGKPMLGPDPNADPVLAIIKSACGKATKQLKRELQDAEMLCSDLQRQRDDLAIQIDALMDDSRERDKEFDALQSRAAATPATASEQPKITKADLQTTGEKVPYFGHMRKKT